MPEEKRKRSPNWLPFEKELLLGLVEIHFNIIENKKTDSASLRSKLAQWQLIADQYNSRTTHCARTGENLKSQWESMKKVARKDAATIRQHMIQTGGGPPIHPKKEDPFLQRILSLISTTAVGLFNTYDSDSDVPVGQDEAVIPATHTEDFPDPPPEQEIVCILEPPVPITIEDQRSDTELRPTCDTQESVKKDTPQLLRTPFTGGIKIDSKRLAAATKPHTRPTHTSTTSFLEELHKKKIEAIEIQKKLAVEEMERAKALHEINIQIAKEKLRQEKIKTQILFIRRKKLLEPTIKQERLSTSHDVPSPETDPSNEECSRHFVKAEFDISKSGSSLPNKPEVTSSFRENTEFVSVKCEYDDASDSNDTEEEEMSAQPIPNCTVKVEKSNEDMDETDKRKSLIKDNLTEKDKHLTNIKSLLEFTNATLIRSQEDVGYTCYFCDKYYQNPSDLKRHATNTHTVVDEKDFTKIYIAGYVGKMDITGLSCKICFTSIGSLENAISHLHDVHRKNVFLDLKNQILPFKFNSNVHRCCICSKEFNKFRSLQSHVQTHYRHYKCEECDMAFINRMKLVQHLQAHVVGEFKCQFCSKQFNTEFKKKKHEKNVHDQSLKVKCGICNERFKYPRQKELHMTKIHSLEPTNKCNLCDKVFVTQDTLSVHVKRDHLKTRNARCPDCEMCFFSPSQLRIHMVKHTGIPQFECDICHKSYRRKNYYYEHMRIHTNDRRHKCKLCDMAFVHKSSLRHHLRAKHGEKYIPGFH